MYTSSKFSLIEFIGQDLKEVENKVRSWKAIHPYEEPPEKFRPYVIDIGIISITTSVTHIVNMSNTIMPIEKQYTCIVAYNKISTPCN